MVTVSGLLRLLTGVTSITINPPGVTQELMVDGKFFVKPPSIGTQTA